MSDAIGIDDLNVYGSSLSVAASEIGRARGVSEEKLEHLRLRRRSLPPSFEDPVTLAVNAALPVVRELGVDRIGLLIVATESAVDYAKPLSAYVHHYLGLSERCRHLEVKHACYGATAALHLASAWVAGGGDDGAGADRRALVISTDMARKLFDDPAEPAEGAGACAMSIGRAPRVLALEPLSGVAAREIFDVFRPTPTAEIIHASLSLSAYLDLFESAWEAYRDAAGARALDRLAYVVYHTPIIPLTEQAHRLLVQAERPDASDEELARSVEGMVRPGQVYSQELGNLYSGSLYASLASLIDGVGPRCGGERVGLYSYGSGSCAEFFSGVLGEGAHEVLAGHRIGDHLAARRAVDVKRYERIVLDSERGLTRADFEPDASLVPELYDAAYRGSGRLVLRGVREHYRSYRWS